MSFSDWVGLLGLIVGVIGVVVGIIGVCNLSKANKLKAKNITDSTIGACLCYTTAFMNKSSIVS